MVKCWYPHGRSACLNSEERMYLDWVRATDPPTTAPAPTGVIATPAPIGETPLANLPSFTVRANREAFILDVNSCSSLMCMYVCVYMYVCARMYVCMYVCMR